MVIILLYSLFRQCSPVILFYYRVYVAHHLPRSNIQYYYCYYYYYYTNYNTVFNALLLICVFSCSHDVGCNEHTNRGCHRADDARVIHETNAHRSKVPTEYRHDGIRIEPLYVLYLRMFEKILIRHRML